MQREGLDWAVKYLEGLVEEEHKKEGIEPQRVLVGGFSQVPYSIYHNPLKEGIELNKS